MVDAMLRNDNGRQRNVHALSLEVTNTIPFCPENKRALERLLVGLNGLDFLDIYYADPDLKTTDENWEWILRLVCPKKHFGPSVSAARKRSIRTRSFMLPRNTVFVQPTISAAS